MKLLLEVGFIHFIYVMIKLNKDISSLDQYSENLVEELNIILDFYVKRMDELYGPMEDEEGEKEEVYGPEYFNELKEAIQLKKL